MVLAPDVAIGHVRGHRSRPRPRAGGPRPPRLNRRSPARLPARGVRPCEAEPVLRADEATTLTPPPDLVEGRRGLRLFAQTDDQPRARRATDVILLGLSCLWLLTVALL